MSRPTTEEHAPYFAKYIDLVPGDDIVSTLKSQNPTALSFWGSLSEVQGESRPAGKWSIKQVLHHLVDTERVFSYRALRIARGDKTPRAGFEQDDFVASAEADRRTMADIVEEYAAVRQATMTLLGSFRDADWSRIGTSGTNPLSTLAAAYVIAGHELHHIAILKRDYL